MKKALIAAGVVVVLATGIIVLRKFTAKDPPIEVGDGSIKLHYDGGIKQSSDPHEIEPDKFLHKVKSIQISDYNGSVTSTIDVKGRLWAITSNSTPGFQISLRSHSLGLEDGVPALCPVVWSGANSDYICTPSGGTQLTPATITFSDGNCPGTSSPSCPVSCPTGKCQLSFEYK
jgi:hypothetical protein